MPPAPRKRTTALIVILGLVVCYWVLLQDLSHPHHKNFSHQPNAVSAYPAAILRKQRQLAKSIRDYTAFFKGLEKYDPMSDSIKDKYKDGKAKEAFSGTDFLFSKEYLENILDIPDATFDKLKDSHTRYVNVYMDNLINKLGVATFGRHLPIDPDWNQYVGSKGYVMVGGGKYSWLSYLVIKQLRATGSKLPVELFIPGKSDYDANFCEKILPKYNARCNVFDEKLAKSLETRFGIHGYQYKLLAFLSLNFENVLYLDSDGFPARNLDYMFESEIYTATGLVIWPDAWARTTNPKFYEIAGLTVEEKRVRFTSGKDAEDPERDTKHWDFTNANYHDFKGTIPDPSSETGILLFNKTKQLRTMLLTLYYNVFGPQHYYPLLTQGSAGEGDKDTFIAAAVVLDEPWFQTLKQFAWIGYHRDDSFSLKALGHYDPQGSIRAAGDDKADVDLVFMHCLYPKFYPDWLANNKEFVMDDDKHVRMYESVYDNVGYDFDLRLVQIFVQGLCESYYDELGNAVDGSGTKKSEEFVGEDLTYLQEGKKDFQSWCLNIFIPHLVWLKQTSKFDTK